MAAGMRGSCSDYIRSQSGESHEPSDSASCLLSIAPFIHRVALLTAQLDLSASTTVLQGLPHRFAQSLVLSH